jgi:hypothetical protein
MTVDYSSLDPLKEAASTATTNYATAVESAPSLLQQLQKNLTTLFTTDNPILEERNTSLADYLSAGANARSDILTGNLPTVEGSALTLSPTQQNAIVSGRKAAALAKLIGLNQAVTGIYGNMSSTVENTGDLYQSLLAGEKTKAELAQQTYKDAFSELTQKEQLRLQELSTMLSASGAGTATGRAESVLNNVATDARSGATLSDIMKKYSTSAYVTPADVLRVYNTNSIYGTAKETSTELQKMYGITPNMTAEQINKQAALVPAQTAIDEIRKLDLSETGPDNRMAQVSLNYLGGIGVSENLVSLNQNFELLRQKVVNALQGARMSDKDIELAKGYIPSIIDTPQVAQTKLNNLQTFINSLMGTTSTTSSSWELIQ